MVTRRCPLSFGILIAMGGLLGCVGYRTPMDEPGASSAPTASPGDASAYRAVDYLRRDLGRNDLGRDGQPDGARDLAADSSRDRSVDQGRDVGVDQPRDLGRDQGRDVGVDQGRDLGRDLVVDQARDLAADRARDVAGPDARIFAGCTPGTPYVLVLGADEVLYRFAPDTLALTRIAGVSCGSNSLNSLTASPLGPAYISNHSGQLCVVDLTTFTSVLTIFDPAVIMDSYYGMAVLPDQVPAGQSLYIATNSAYGQPNTLSRIDLSSFQLTTIGLIQPVVAEVELTAGPSGELYGFSIGTVTSKLLTIDPRTGIAIDVTTVPAGTTKPAFALVNWQGDFYLFLGESSSSPGTADVFRYHKGDAEVSRVGGISPAIIGAGVALCH